MKNLPQSLEEHLASGATTLCNCWRLARVDGATLGFMDHDRPLAFGGTTFEPETGGDGSSLVSAADLAPDNAEVEGAFSSEKLSAEDLAAGKYDGATLEVWRVNWAAPEQRVLLKRGVLGETTREAGRFRVEMRGRAHELSRAVGRVYQRHCDAIVGDARCGVDLGAPALRGAGTVSEEINEQAFIASGLGAFADAWFDHGVLTWTSGANAGVRAHVKSHQPGAGGARLSLWLPAGAPIVAGDAFIITAGCDRLHTTCKAKFNNLVNFRGFHLMPGNDFAISYPVRADDNDGGRR